MNSTSRVGIPADRHPSVAVAVWVKTPGHTAAKTRLAKVIGTPDAEAFYQLAVAAVRELVDEACRLAPGLLAPYWAVAEPHPAAQACWSGYPILAQGEGSLGERLARVYDMVEPRHRAVIFIGADSPQLPPAALVHAGTLLHASSPAFVIGPAIDGGFYLFGGRGALSHTAWTSVTYSAPTTMAELVAALEPLGPVHLLPAAFDVDTIDDLRLLHDELAGTSAGGAARRALRHWLQSRASVFWRS